MSLLVGIDEVGRGAWAGPVVAAAVVLRKPVNGLKDSKLLSRTQREQLARIINKKARAISLGWVWPREIDELGLTKAIALAMNQAVTGVKLIYDQIIIDGAYNFLPDNPKSSVLIKADSLIPSVSAASIVAKVARDGYMAKMAKKYPKYFFEKHVGYGTALHRWALETNGLCELHRRSYKPIQKLVSTM